MTKSKRILSVVLSIVMILTIIPMGVFSASASSAITNDGKLVIPQVKLEATPVFRIADASNHYIPGSTLVNATDSGLAEIASSTWSNQFYAGETPHGYQVVLTSDKALSGTPTLSCSVSTLAIDGPSKSGNTYTWYVSAGTAALSVGAIQFTADYTYSYKDNLTGVTKEYTYKAYTSSWVDNISNGVGIYEKYQRTGTAKKPTQYWVHKILGKNTYGSLMGTETKFQQGYYSFNSNSWSSNAAWNGLGFLADNDFNSGDGNKDRSTGVDGNRTLATTYIDRNGTECAPLSNNSLRYYMFDASDDMDTGNKHIISLKVIPGISEWGSETLNNPTSAGQIGIEAFQINSTGDEDGQQVALNAMLQWPMTGSTYDAVATLDTASGNYFSDYTLIGKAGAFLKANLGQVRNCNVQTAISLRIVSYDKYELRSYVSELLSQNDPLTKPAATSAIGLNPQEQWYSAGWTTYKTALTNAQNILAQPNTTQVAIDNALSSLESAVGGLVVKEANYDALNIAEANLNSKNSSLYTTASWNNAGDKYDAAEATRGYSIFYQNAVDKATAELEAAILALEFLPADWEPLEEAIDAYYDVDPSLWSEASYQALVDAVEYAEAQRELHEADYTINDQSTINDLAQAIWTAIDPGLKPATADYTQFDAQVARYENEILAQKAAVEQALADAGIDWQAIVAAAGTDTIYEQKAWNRVQDKLGLERGLSRDYQDYIDDETYDLSDYIDALNGKFIAADYSAVNAQLTAAGAVEESWYTPASYQVLENAVNAVRTGKKINEQITVNGYATAIANAIAGLIEADADYSQFLVLKAQAEALDASLYTSESYNAVFTAIGNVNLNYKAKNQSTLNTEVGAVQTALNSLVKLPADYSAIESAQTAWNARTDKDNYTAESVAAVAKAFQDVDWTKKKDEQADVDAMLANINAKLAALALKGADYTALEAKYAEAKAAVSQQTSFAASHNGMAYYTTDSYAALTSAIAVLDLDTDGNIIHDKTILQQADVDAMLSTLTAAVAGLKKNPADVTPLTTALAKIPADIEEDGLYEVNSAAAVLALAADAQGYVDNAANYDVEAQADIDALAAELEAAIAALKINLADYTAVIAQVNRKNADYADLSIYYADQAAAVTAALAAIPMDNGEVLQNKSIKQQAEVDKMAKDLKDALDALEIAYADYTDVDAAIAAANTETAKGIYTDASVAAVTTAINNVVRDKYLKDQADVDAMAAAINTAVANLVVKGLDLTTYNAAVASVPADLSIYTGASVAAMNAAKKAADDYKAVAENNKITNQDAFEALVADYADAIAALEVKPLDLTSYNAAVAKIPADLSIYTSTSVVALNTAKNTADNFKAVEANNKITKQTAFEALVSAIETAVANLVEKPLDLTSYNAANARVPADLSRYTDASVAVMNAAKKAADDFKAVEENNKITKQTEFEALVSAYDTAITNLVPNLADYTELNALVAYVNSIADWENPDVDPDCFENWDEIYWGYMSDFIDNIDYNHTLDEQDEVDAMVIELQGYIDMLEGKLCGIEIVTEPAKTAYVTGDTADYTGLEVKALFFGGKEATLADTDYTVSGFDSSAAGTKTITVAYEGFEDTFTVEVTWGEGDYTEVNAKVDYINALADNWGVDEDGTEYINFDEIYWDYMYEYIDMGITYGLSAEFQDDIDAMAAQLQEYIDMLKTAAPAVELVSIAVKTAPAKTAYTVGDTADYTGLVIEATYSDGTTADVTADCALSGFDSATAGTKTITATYEGKTATFSVTVEEVPVELVSIAVKTAPAKTAYTVGDTADYTGLVIEATYSDGTTADVTADCALSGFDSATAGTKTITATYEGKTATFSVTVEEAVVEYFNWAEDITVKEEGGVQYVYGFTTGNTEKAFLNGFTEYENVTVTVEKSSSRYVGTGSKVIVEYSSGKVDEYIVIIFGDLDGSSRIDSKDADILADSLNGALDPLEGEYKLAADIYGTGRKATLNGLDQSKLYSVATSELEIDQKTGKVIEAE